MGGTGVIDTFLGVFTSYIDSGFGLLGGEVAFIASTLIVIDVTLAALFWAWGADDDIIARLVKKTLFVGVFAWLISNWNSLAAIVFDSFAGAGALGLRHQLLARRSPAPLDGWRRPGSMPGDRFWTPRPISWASSPSSRTSSRSPALLFAWALVLLAFFLLAVQLFVTLIEFKLTTLAGFVLIPFGLFGKTAFMAERVLGNVVSSGIKVLVLAVIIGIGSTLFGQFTAGFGGVTPTIDEAMAIVLAALSLLGLGIFGPGIATGLVSGGPQLGAGAAVGTGLAVGGAAVAAGGGAMLGARGAGALASGGAAATRGAAAATGAASAAYTLGIDGPDRSRKRRLRTRRLGAGRGRGSDFAPTPGRRRGLRGRQGKSCRRRPRWLCRHWGLLIHGQRCRCVSRLGRPCGQPTGLGALHALQPDHEPWRLRRHPCAAGRGQSWLRRLRPPV